MKKTSILYSSVTVVTLLAASSAQGQGLPMCRVRLLQSAAAAEATPRGVRDDVKSWVDVPERGCELVSSIDEADVLLELNQYRTKTMPDGMPAQELWLIARRLNEPHRERATHRFIYLTTLDPRSTQHVAQDLPTVLKDVCFGWLPEDASAAHRP